VPSILAILPGRFLLPGVDLELSGESLTPLPNLRPWTRSRVLRHHQAFEEKWSPKSLAPATRTRTPATSNGSNRQKTPRRGFTTSSVFMRELTSFDYEYVEFCLGVLRDIATPWLTR
jgi:hypothetical protein